MKVIFDNIIFFLQRSGGMSVYWSEIISRMETNKEIQAEFLEPIGACQNIFYNSIRRKIQSRIKTEKWSAKILSFLRYSKRAETYYIFHSSYYRTSRSPQAINVVTIHDFIPETFFGGIGRFYHAYRKRKAINNAQGIICISRNTHEDLLLYYPATKSIPTKIIYNGVSKDYYPISKKVLEQSKQLKKYILFVGKRPPYKNFFFAIDVLYKLCRYHFVIVGESLSRKEKEYLEKLKDGYTFFLNPDNKRLNELYNNAHCLLYPSSYEGFGIPVIEAMRSGCPVVGLNAGAVPEIAHGAALLAQELNITEFVKNVSELEHDELRWSIVSKGIENAKKFDWDSSYNELISFYKSLYYRYN